LPSWTLIRNPVFRCILIIIHVSKFTLPGAIRLLRSEVMPNFSTKVEEAVVALTSLPPRHVDENDFIDASRLVYDGVREVRRAVLLNRAEEEIDTDTDWEEEGADMGEVAVGGEGGSVRPQVESRTDSVIDEYPNISGTIRAPFFVNFFVTDIGTLPGQR